MRRRTVVLALLLSIAAAGPASAQLPPIDRVFIIAFENREISDVVGAPSAPYLNSLIAQYGVATNYTSGQHPSLPNYMAVTGGQPAFTINCNDCRTDGPSIADSIEASGRTWTAYMEGMSGTCGTVDEGLYAVRHNPFVHYSSIANNPARCSRIVPFGRFASDLSAGTLSNYVWITPDLCHDMHDCDISAGDAWLQSLVPSIVASPSFANAMLVIWWDEGTTDVGGGGKMPLIVISPRTPRGTASAAPSGHYDVLRTIEELWNLPLLGQSASARPLFEFLNLLERPGFEEYSVPALGAPGWRSDAPPRQVPAVSERLRPRTGLQNAACRTSDYLDCGMIQPLIAPRSGTYTLTAYANSDRAGALVGADVKGAWAASAPVEARGAAGYGTPYVVRFTASAGDTISVWMYSPAKPGWLVMDDVSLVFSSVPNSTYSISTWTTQDVGAVGLSGSATLSGGVWTVAGAGGAAVWGAADAFRFVYQPLSGDGQVTARVDSLQNTTPFAKAGVMLRDGVTPEAAHVILSIRPTGDLEFMQRSATGGGTRFIATAPTPPPYWVRLARAGTNVTASISSDGAIWVPVGTATAAMPASVLAGMVVTSNDSSRLNTARFEGVSLTTAPWTNQDVGSVGVVGNATGAGASFTLSGAGATGVWGTSDAFQFVHRSLTGDGEIVARLTALGNTNAFAKAGIMMRDGLSAGAANVILDVRPTNDVEFMQRKSAGGATTFYATAKAPPPGWLRLSRSGGTITAAISADGITWSTLGSTPASMSSTIQVGLIVTSVNGNQLNTATFDGVVVR